MSWSPKKQKEYEPEPTQRIKDLIEISDKRGLDYKKSADDIFEMHFYDTARQTKNTLETFIPWLHRVKVNKNFVKDNASDEVLIWYEQNTVNQHDGEPMQLNQRCGVMLLPVAKIRTKQGRKVVTGSQGTVPYYTTPFTPEKVDEIIASSITDVEKYHISYGTIKGPDVVTGVHRTIHNLDDFKYGTFQELWDMSAFNYSTKEPRLTMWREEGDQIKKQAQTFNAMAAQR